MNKKAKYFIVEADTLPEIYRKVAEARQLLELGEVETVNAAVQRVGISRSAFYKHRDSVQPFNDMLHGRILTFQIMLRHEPELHGDGCTLASGFRISWAEELTAAVEPIEITDGRMKNSYPGTLWRLMLTAVPAEKHAQEFIFEE